MKHIQHKGFIALISAVIISVVMMGLALTAGASSAFSRMNSLYAEYKRVSLALAESCANVALLKISQDYNYTPGAGDTVTIGTDGQGRVETCTIKSVAFPGGKSGVQNTAVITTQSTYPSTNGAFSTVTISSSVQNPAYAVPGEGTVAVQVHFVNNDGGTKQAGDVTVSASGVNPYPSSFPGAETGTTVYFNPGGYSISTNSLSGYTKNTSAGCTGTIQAGDSDSCVITYDDIPTTASLIVTAQVKNDNGGTLQPSDFPLYIDGLPTISGVPVTGLDPTVSHTASAAATPAGYSASVWGTDCAIPGTGSITLQAGQKKTCTIVYDDNPPPAPICVDTVLMLDRTGSMGGQDLIDEKSAANNLLNLYAALTPLPKSSVGVFGAVGASEPYNANIRQALTTVYSSLTSAVNTGLASSGGYTNLASAISTSQAEFDANGTSGKGHVLILISDGGANRPTGSTAGSTGIFSPSANVQNATGELWSNPGNAYASGGGVASDPVSENDHHRFYNFNFPAIPTNATNFGIEVDADAFASTPTTLPTPGNAQKTPSTVGALNQWTGGGNAFTSNDVYATSAVNGQQESYGTFGFAIPSGATITGIQVTTEDKVGGFASAQSGAYVPGSVGNYNTTSWTTQNGSTNTNSKVNAVNDANDNTYITTSTSGAAQTFKIDTVGIPANSVINSVTVTARAEKSGSSGSPTFSIRAEKGTGGGSQFDYAPAGSLGTSYGNFSGPVWTKDPITNANWGTVENLAATWNFGVIKTNGSGTVRVSEITVSINYSPPATSGSLSVALSSNNGGSWTSAKTTTFDTNESIDTPSGNSATDLWGRTSWAPSDFNNGTFALRVQNTTAAGTVSLDNVVVTVNYTVQAMAPVACTLGMDLSWDGGNTWTSGGFGGGEKTVTLTGTQATYAFGSASDAWTFSHAWTAGDFTNNNFRVRIHASDPGSNCDNASSDQVDWLRANVSYSIPLDPFDLALAAADAAKAAGTQIFTIHFGDNGNANHDINFLANIANGSTAVSGHQNGSANDLGDTPVSGNSGWISPSTNVKDTGGDGNGFETNAGSVYADGGGFASNIDGTGDRHRFGGYSFNLPAGAAVTGIVVRPDWFTDSTSGTNSLSVELSWDNGAHWTSAKTEGTESTSDTNSKTLGSSSDLWGRTSWSSSDLSSANFLVRVTSNSTVSTRDFYLDWLPVEVYYTGAVPENGDNDNFYVSPTSADMQSIFQAIGEKVCPALTAPPPAPPPTHGTLLVISHVINDNGGVAQPSDFQMTVTGLNANPNTFPMAGVDAPGTSIQLDPGSYSVSGDTMGLLYGVTTSGCSGTMAAGSILTCTLTYDDLPPPAGTTGTPLPPSNIIIGSWQETP